LLSYKITPLTIGFRSVVHVFRVKEDILLPHKIIVRH